MFNCDVPQTLFVINSAAVGLKIINTNLCVFLKVLIILFGHLWVAELTYR
jgi:hypothetical protein